MNVILKNYPKIVQIVQGAPWSDLDLQPVYEYHLKDRHRANMFVRWHIRKHIATRQKYDNATSRPQDNSFDPAQYYNPREGDEKDQMLFMVNIRSLQGLTDANIDEESVEFFEGKDKFRRKRKIDYFIGALELEESLNDNISQILYEAASNIIVIREKYSVEREVLSETEQANIIEK